MPTRFMHLVLAWQGAKDAGLNGEERLDFLVGSLFPDVAEFSQKTATHFSRGRFSFGYDRKRMEQTLSALTFWTAAGWEIHLCLDQLWQRICFLPGLHRLPFLMIRWGARLGEKYYEELSGFDVAYRRCLTDEELRELKEIVRQLTLYKPPACTPADPGRWPAFLRSLREDLGKGESYQGPQFVGERRFFLFSGQGRELVRRRVAAIKGSAGK